MQTNESDTQLALQPESEIEQAVLMELYEKLARQSEAPSHPEKIGTELVFFTLDIPEYPDLDADLWEDADCGVNEHGQLEPDPGSRALVIIYDEEAQSEAISGGSDVEEETQEAVDEAVEQLKTGHDENNEYSVSLEDAYNAAEDAIMSDDPDYNDDLQEAAKMASTVGDDIPANQSGEDIIDDLRDFIGAIENDPEVEV